MTENLEEVKRVDEVLSNDKERDERESCKLEFEKLNKRIRKLEVISVISLVLLIIILGMNFVNQPQSDSSVIQTTNQKELPSNLNKEEIEELGKNVVEAYNSNDIEKLYSVLGSYAQTMVTIEELEETMKGLKILGNIGKYSFSHYEFMGNDNGADWYSLNYVASYAAGNGTLKINLRVTNGEWDIVGYYMNVEKLDLDKLEN